MELTKLKIKNAIYYGYHGVAAAEKALGGKYQVDLEIWYNAESAINTDDISYAINYQDVLYTVSDIIQNENFNLIEALANEILVVILDRFTIIEKATINIRKLSAPVNQYLDYIEVEQTVEREKPNFETVIND